MMVCRSNIFSTSLNTILCVYEHEDMMDYDREQDDWESGDYEIYNSGSDDDYFEYIDDIYHYYDE
jgi:hypothetical protein